MTVLLTTEQRLTSSEAGWRSRSPLTMLADIRRRGGKVAVLARRDDSTAPDGLLVQADSVFASPVLTASGRLPLQMWRTARTTWAAVGSSQAVVAVLPGLASPLAVMFSRLRGRRLGVVVAGDPAESLAPGAVVHPLRAVTRRALVTLTRSACQHADSVLYVTAATLQQRYPPGPATRVYASTDVAKPILSDPRGWPDREPVRLLTVASMDQPYKGIDTLTDAVTGLRAQGAQVTLTVVGEGRLRPQYEERARGRLGDAVDFLGALAADQVQLQYTQADVFVLASLTEGLPRVLVEAMGRGLPCVATVVGGVPELIDPPWLVPARDPVALADALARIAHDGTAYETASRVNIERVRTLLDTDPQGVRDRFLDSLLASGRIQT